MSGRTIAIGDVHGCSAALAALVGAIDPGPGDTIVTLGDYINRGPDSRGVLETLIDLSGRCRLLPLLGNHDEILLDVLAGRRGLHVWLSMGGLATLTSYGPGCDPAAIPEAHLKFLEGCLPYFEASDHIFVHANYWPELPMAEQPPWLLRWESLRERLPGPHASGKRVIAGHTSQKTGEVLDLEYLVCIDTYCHGGGWLTALEVGTGRLWQARRDGTLRR